MAKKPRARLTAEELQADLDFLEALKKLDGYQPSDPKFSIEALQASQDAMCAAQEAARAAQKALDEAHAASVAAQRKYEEEVRRATLSRACAAHLAARDSGHSQRLTGRRWRRAG